MSQDLDKTFPKDINKMLDLVAYKLNSLVGMFEMRQNGDIYLFGGTLKHQLAISRPGQ